MKFIRDLRSLGLFTTGILLGGQAFAGPLVISEFRVRGPNGANDEYIEVYNPGSTSHTVTSSSGSGYGVAASDGVVRFSIPNGTVIPAHGHYLGVNSVGYSLASTPAGNGTTATGDATYTSDIPDNAGIALFTTNLPGDFAPGTRMDAVGSTSEANTLYKEGTGYPALVPFSINYAFYRDACGKGGSITDLGLCPTPGTVLDTDNNAADFIFVDTNGTSAGAGQRLGAPGPENLSSPITNGSGLTVGLLDSCVADATPPNQVRDFTSDPANNSTFGTMDLRFTFTNNTGADLTRLRFRLFDLATFPAPSGIADTRPRTSSAVVVTVDRTPCGSGTSNVTVQGTTLEQPPAQPNGGGFNTTMSVDAVDAVTPLVNGGAIDVRLLLGLQQTGDFKLALVPEALPEAGISGGVLYLQCNTETATCAVFTPPVVSSSVRASANPAVPGATVDYTVTFSQAVTGVDASDFVLTTAGLSGASVSGVAGSGTTYTVSVNVGTGNGTLRLDVQDDDSIANATAVALGGAGVGNGNFTTGEVYTVGAAPAVAAVPVSSKEALFGLVLAMLGLVGVARGRERSAGR